ncbi:hypothetical protein [Acidithiobacillus sulfuriphilus]|uniref:hypothetical protein n=1 Tax=Acidithiobacillus sulfuriphilus TaxID=1867749 RepID=UPI003F5F5068
MRTPDYTSMMFERLLSSEKGLRFLQRRVGAGCKGGRLRRRDDVPCGIVCPLAGF